MRNCCLMYLTFTTTELGLLRAVLVSLMSLKFALYPSKTDSDEQTLTSQMVPVHLLVTFLLSKASQRMEV